MTRRAWATLILMGVMICMTARAEAPGPVHPARQAAPADLRFQEYGSTVGLGNLMRAVPVPGAGGTLTIAPWATYYGGSGEDIGYGIAADANGNVIIAGKSASIDLPVTPGLQTQSAGGYDVFLCKYDQTGTRMWSTYFGGSGDDDAAGVHVDPQGNIVVSGLTSSTNLPVTAGALQSVNRGSCDYYIAKFSPSGTLIWATYYGGTANDEISAGVTTDLSGNVFIAGATLSKDLTTTAGAFMPTLGKKDGGYHAFIVKLSSSGALLWATYYTGVAYGLTTDEAGAVYIAGQGGEGFLTTPGCFQPLSGGGADAFLVKFDAAGGREWATLFGGSVNDWGRAVSCSASGLVALAGYTYGANLPVTPGAFQTVYGGGTFDAFIAVFSSTGSRLWASFIGGSGGDVARTVAWSPTGDVHVGGYTSGGSMPVLPGAFQSVNAGGYDGFVTIFDANGTAKYGSHYGGTLDDNILSLAIAPSGALLLAGRTLSTDFPVYNASQAALAGGSDAFCLVLEPDGTLPGFNRAPVAVAAALPNRGSVPLTTTFSSASSHDLDGTIVAYAWSFGDGGTSTEAAPVHTYTVAGVYTVQLIVTDDDNATGTTTITVTVDPAGSFLHAAAMQISRVYLGNKKWKGVATITVHDNASLPVAGATVTATYSGVNAGTASGITNTSGIAVLETRSCVLPNSTVRWCFTVTNVQCPGYTFLPDAGITTACEAPAKESPASIATSFVETSPNPFTGMTTFTITQSDPARVTITLHDLVGREVARVFDAERSSGVHRIPFNAAALSVGVYFYRVFIGSELHTGTVMHVK